MRRAPVAGSLLLPIQYFKGFHLSGCKNAANSKHFLNEIPRMHDLFKTFSACNARKNGLKELLENWGREVVKILQSFIFAHK